MTNNTKPTAPSVARKAKVFDAQWAFLDASKQWLKVFGLLALLVGGGWLYFSDAIVASIFSTPHPELVFSIFGVAGIAVVLTANVVRLVARERIWFKRLEAASRKDRAQMISMRRDHSEFLPVYRLMLATQGRAVNERQKALEHEVDGTEADVMSKLALPNLLSGGLVGLGLVGTFIGLLETLSQLSGVFEALGGASGGGDAASMFSDMIARLQGPMRGMGTAFVASLYGLLGSLVIGITILAARRITEALFSDIRLFVSEELYAETAGGTAGFSTLTEFVPLGAHQWDAMILAFREEHSELRNSLDAWLVRLEGQIGALSETTSTLNRQLSQSVAGMIDVTDRSSAALEVALDVESRVGKSVALAGQTLAERIDALRGDLRVASANGTLVFGRAALTTAVFGGIAGLVAVFLWISAGNARLEASRNERQTDFERRFEEQVGERLDRVAEDIAAGRLALEEALANKPAEEVRSLAPEDTLEENAGDMGEGNADAVEIEPQDSMQTEGADAEGGEKSIVDGGVAGTGSNLAEGTGTEGDVTDAPTEADPPAVPVEASTSGSENIDGNGPDASSSQEDKPKEGADEGTQTLGGQSAQPLSADDSAGSNTGTVSATDSIGSDQTGDEVESGDQASTAGADSNFGSSEGAVPTAADDANQNSSSSSDSMNSSQVKGDNANSTEIPPTARSTELNSGLKLETDGLAEDGAGESTQSASPVTTTEAETTTDEVGGSDTQEASDGALVNEDTSANVDPMGSTSTDEGTSATVETPSTVETAEGIVNLPGDASSSETTISAEVVEPNLEVVPSVPQTLEEALGVEPPLATVPVEPEVETEKPSTPGDGTPATSQDVEVIAGSETQSEVIDPVDPGVSDQQPTVLTEVPELDAADTEANSVQNPELSVPSLAPSAQDEANSYVVQVGDTLLQVSQRTGVPLEQLLRLNPEVTNPDFVIPGQVLRVRE